MKKLILLYPLFSLFLLSCSGEDDGPGPRDNSLEGSVGYEYWLDKVEFYEDGVLMETDPLSFMPVLKITKRTDAGVVINFYTRKNSFDFLFSYYLAQVPVGGKPYDATFSYLSTDRNDILRINGEILDPALVKFEGWMKVDSDWKPATRDSWGPPPYKGELNAEFTLDNGKKYLIFMVI